MHWQTRFKGGRPINRVLPALQMVPEGGIVALFKSKHEKVLEYIRDSYTTAMRSFWDQLPGLRQNHGVTDFRAEMAQHHKTALNNACRWALKNKGISPEPDMLSQGYWAMTCATFGLGDPLVAPNPWNQRFVPNSGSGGFTTKPQESLTETQRAAYTSAYSDAFDQWMRPRIRSGSVSPKDFARGEYFAHSEAWDTLRDADSEALLEDVKNLRSRLYAANVERWGYTDKLPNPLPTMGD